MPAGLAGRYAAIDHLNAMAIVAVCVTHAMPSVFEPGTTAVDRLVTAMLSFHVPAFLFAAGFLATRRGPVGFGQVRARLQRVLVPYFLASLVALLLGLWATPTLRRLVFHLVTGSALGIYYFVPVLAFCLLTLPLVSRLPTLPLTALVLVLACYSVLAERDPDWRLTTALFWQIRDVLLQFHLGHFLMGVIAARQLPTLRGARERVAPLVAAVSILAIAAFAWTAASGSPWMWAQVGRAAYLLGIIGLTVTAVPRGVAPAPIRFLSDATLTIYLYHHMIYPFVLPELRTVLPPATAAIVTAMLGVALGSAVALAGRVLLGGASRSLVGT